MKKVMLIAGQGTGTTLFRAFLNSHPEIEFVDEIFTRSERLEEYKEEFKEDGVGRFLKDFYDGKMDKVGVNKVELEGKKVLGCDVKYTNLKSVELPCLKFVEENGVHIIHLLRDKARSYLRSWTDPNERHTYNELLIWADFARWWENRIRVRFEKGNYLEITYEDMTRGRNLEGGDLPEDFERRILEWLDVKYQRLSLSRKYAFKPLVKRFL